MKGQCHCSAVTVDFETGQTLEDLVARACQCAFCRKHGARTVADPQGQLTVTSASNEAINRYRFGERTADFLICASCGVYLCAVVEADGLFYSTLNINVMDDRTAFSDRDEPVSYDGEAVASRIARRVKAWTPTQIVVSGG